MPFNKATLSLALALITTTTLAAGIAKPALSAQSAGTPEGRRLSELASLCAENYADLTGEISARLYQFRNSGASLSTQGRSVIVSVASRSNPTKDECTGISAILTNR